MISKIVEVAKSMKNLIGSLAENRLVNFVIGIVCIISGAAEIYRELEAVDGALIHGGHGVLTMGLWHMLKGFGEAMEAFDYLSKAEK